MRVRASQAVRQEGVGIRVRMGQGMLRLDLECLWGKKHWWELDRSWMFGCLHSRRSLLAFCTVYRTDSKVVVYTLSLWEVVSWICSRTVVILHIYLTTFPTTTFVPTHCSLLDLASQQITRPLITPQEDRTSYTNPPNPGPYPRKEGSWPALLQYRA